jgi:hypothetical protein
MSNGDEKNLVTFYTVIVVIEIFWSPQKVNLCHLFGKPLARDFQNHVTCLVFLVTEKFRSPSNSGGVWDGDKKHLVIIQHIPNHQMATEEF